jgi:hypothetical protein
MNQDRVETVQPNTLSALEEDLDHPPPLGEGEAPLVRGLWFPKITRIHLLM